jgi:O-antigen/teichoic acid export membrane protein
VYGKLKYIVVINILAALINVAINLLLIPLYGPLGAACGTCGTMILHNIMKQAGLRFGTGISVFEWKYFQVYLGIIMGAVVLLLVQIAMPNNYSWKEPYIYVSFALAAVVALLVVGLNRKSLNVGETFPELLRFPLVRRVFGG